MSVPELFGGKRQRRDQPMYPPTSPLPQHEHAAQALAFVTSLNDEVAGLRAENTNLREQLHLSTRRCQDVERLLHAMQSDLEQYRRYAVEVKTHLQHIVDVANRANDKALEASEHREPMAAAQAEAVIEKVAEEISAEQIGRKFGAGK